PAPIGEAAQNDLRRQDERIARLRLRRPRDEGVPAASSVISTAATSARHEFIDDDTSPAAAPAIASAGPVDNIPQGAPPTGEGAAAAPGAEGVAGGGALRGPGEKAS